VTRAPMAIDTLKLLCAIDWFVALHDALILSLVLAQHFSNHA